MWEIRATAPKPRSGAEIISGASAIGVGSDERGVVAAALEAVPELIQCDRAFIVLASEDRAFRLHSLDGEGRATEVAYAPGELLDRTLHRGEPVLIRDVASEPHPEPTLLSMCRDREFAAVPLTVRSDTFGALGAIGGADGMFVRGDLDALAIVAARTSVAIQGTRACAAARAELDAMKEEARRARDDERRRAEFVSVLAHELKGPMASLLGFASLLRDEWDVVPEGRRERCLDIMVDETRRVTRLMEDLLDLSRLETGTLCCDLHDVDLKDLAYRTIEANSALATRHDIVVDVPENLPTVQADNDRISQVLINLLSNATRYSPEGSTVVVRAKPADGQVVVEVADEGIGIPEEHADKVFQKFSTAPKPDWTENGNGVGLFISKGLVEAHGGEMWVDSQPGSGSTFYFSLPAAAASGTG